MRTLYHYPLCPYSRKIRLQLAEKKLDFTLELEKFWEKRPEFLSLNAAGQVPVLIDLNGSVLADSVAICEYLEETYPKDGSLIGEGLPQRAEVRRLIAWFDTRFGRDISERLVFEKIIKRYLPTTGSSGPDSAVIRQAKNAIHHHLDYISWLVDRRNWLAGDHFSLADITAAAHLSVIDYLGDVPWESHLLAKEWYARIKSRPMFRNLLQDRASGLTPSAHYADLDF
ncbi:glutathione S-transferase family protein [Candidatus Finniella inopinata]|uniref:Glutathione S-transferase family protein n=1 Tax=Candidatus Finniella inopinata TaxID=1696036 RepID=A0A4Q7DKH8_9PROT|nr:glutathione S-transferase family protein [Candidatus Finniella inopinata]RZI46890.1 glutathione S-transferase family protein [Candidatus Finniella inopinata]